MVFWSTRLCSTTQKTHIQYYQLCCWKFFKYHVWGLEACHQAPEACGILDMCCEHPWNSRIMVWVVLFCFVFFHLTQSHIEMCTVYSNPAPAESAVSYIKGENKPLCLRGNQGHQERSRLASDHLSPTLSLSPPHTNQSSLHSIDAPGRTLLMLMVCLVLDAGCPSHPGRSDLCDANCLSELPPLATHHLGWPPYLILLLFQKQLIEIGL